MEETVEKIIKEAMESVKNYTLSDQHWILTEVSDRLRNNADECLQMEYFKINMSRIQLHKSIQHVTTANGKLSDKTITLINIMAKKAYGSK